MINYDDEDDEDEDDEELRRALWSPRQQRANEAWAGN
jgi:hypothetical protein